ncbi:MAG TPA: hypothetical protein VKM93_01930 [Terriglobia bacterium]|nr:hypothetical protein [Terriglobia bacterium]
MSDTLKLLERQATWQKCRVALTWAEKVRMAEAVRDSVAQLRRAPPLADSGVSARGHHPTKLPRQGSQT